MKKVAHEPKCDNVETKLASALNAKVVPVLIEALPTKAVESLQARDTPLNCVNVIVEAMITAFPQSPRC